jgi:hypothetical protein
MVMMNIFEKYRFQVYEEMIITGMFPTDTANPKYGKVEADS